MSAKRSGRQRQKDIVIVGAGGFAREVAWLIEEINRQAPTWSFLGYIEADRAQTGQPLGQSRIIGDDEFVERYDRELSVVIGIGRPPIIERIRARLERLPHLRFPNLVHPGVLWDRERIQLGVGNIICAGNILTTDIRLGSFNILNLASTYGHDVVIGDNCVFNPGANVAGRVKIGDTCLLGTNCAVLETLAIGDHATVSAGSLVIRDVAPGQTVIGVPARPLPPKE